MRSRDDPPGKRVSQGDGQPRVLQVALPACPVDPAWDVLERKRRLLWHHQGRNSLVTGLAQALAKVDTDTLRKSGIKLTPEERRRGRKGWRVAVLVESV
jgi:hypothetical protein